LLSLVIPLAAFAAVGVVLPICVLMWLLAHHQPPYVLDRALLETPRTALGGNPVTVRPVYAAAAERGTIALYADGSTSSIVRGQRQAQAIEGAASVLDERRSSSFSIGGFTQRDATLADGRVARTFGIDDTVMVFVAQTPLALDRLVAQSAVRPNAKRDVGNTVLDGHAGAAVAIGIAWLALTALPAALAILRATRTDASMRGRRTVSPPDH
jgi:hypothetical protein